MKLQVFRQISMSISIAAVIALSACGGAENQQESTTSTQQNYTIVADGSSTVFPITAAVAEEFNKIRPEVQVQVAQSGTGGGMKKFVSGEIEISNASRPIKEEEITKAKSNNIQYTEFEIAYDGIVVAVNNKNKFVDSLTVEQLKLIWEPESKVKTWKDVNAAWPDTAIQLYGPGTDSGTFEYFTEAINHKSKAIRKDFTPSEDDNILVQGIAGDEFSLGYFGYAYYLENQDKLKALKIDGGKGAILPSQKTIEDKTYSPLSRPLYLYVNTKALEKEPVKAFLQFYITEGKTLISEVGYVPLEDQKYTVQLEKLK